MIPYRSRFNTLVRAYTLVGFTPDRDFAFIELNRALRRTHAEHCETLLSKLREAGASVRQDPITELFIVNEEFSMSLVMARCQATASGSTRWNLRFDASLRPDVTIASTAIQETSHRRQPLRRNLVARKHNSHQLHA